MVHRAVAGAFQAAPLRRAALGAAAARGRAMVLLYHRISPEGARPYEVVRSVSASLLRRQLEAVSHVADIVPLSQLLGELDEPRGAHRRPRVAITFDDDDAGHVRHALPVLAALGARATFFLSGRALHGLGAYWWVALERMITERGLRGACQTLGVAGGAPRRSPTPAWERRWPSGSAPWPRRCQRRRRRRATHACSETRE